jgi:hypothetical protein
MESVHSSLENRAARGEKLVKLDKIWRRHFGRAAEMERKVKGGERNAQI